MIRKYNVWIQKLAQSLINDYLIEYYLELNNNFFAHNQTNLLLDLATYIIIRCVVQKL